MARGRRKTQVPSQVVKGAEGNTSAPIVRLRVRAEKFTETKNEKTGKMIEVVIPWNQKIKYGGKFYEGGHEFDCDAKIAEMLLDKGVAEKVEDKAVPYKPKPRGIAGTHGIRRAEDVAGLTPVNSIMGGMKGEYENEEDDF